jgi:DNA replication protein DnaC
MWFILFCLGIFIIIFAVFSKKDKEINRLKNENDKLKHADYTLKEQFDKKPANHEGRPTGVKIDNELPVYIDEEAFNDVFRLMEKTNNSMFITGKAGTGKSTLIEYFRKKTKKAAVCLAPTGVAALNIKGKTIHSLFKFPHSVITSDEVDKLKYKEKDKELFRKVEAIVIDEISMVRADVFQGIDYALKKLRLNESPFGGVQMICVGDMYQLPPVVDKKKNCPH